MRVLIAEDDASVSAALAAALGRVGHHTQRVERGGDVLLRHREVDVVLLDLGLVDGDGLEVLRRLRQLSAIPVIVVTARGDELSTVRALELGADDYLVKPVRMHELLARIGAVVRRIAQAQAGAGAGAPNGMGASVDAGRAGSAAPASEPLRMGNTVIDLEARRVVTGDVEVAVTATEFSVLEVLARRAGMAVSRQALLDRVWGDAYAASSRSLDVHIGQLRQKLDEVTITTIRGFGWRLEEAP